MAGQPPDKVDLLVSARIRMRREQRDLTQADIGNALGISDAQAGKIERGKDRISASRLFTLAHYLETDLYYFYQDVRGSLTGPMAGFSEAASDWTPKLTLSDEIAAIAAIMRDQPPEKRALIIEAAKQRITKTS